jgi:PPOX class probable F420-dependent enzyme
MLMVRSGAEEAETAVLDLDSPAGARADRRLRSEQILWLTTVRADGQPQSSPVWFLWDGETLLVFSQPDAQKLRNLAGNPRVAVHLESGGTGDEVVTIDGTAAVDPDVPPSDQIDEYRVKYREGTKALGWTPARLARDFSVAIRIRPTRVRAE